MFFYNKEMFKHRFMNLSRMTTILTLSTLVFVFVFSTTFGGKAYAQLEENVTSSEPSFLFIQSAQSGSLSQINDTAYTLELNDVADKTVSFADRPDRIVESVDTSGFVGNWSANEDSFAIDPPNAALVVLDNSVDASEQDIAIVELFNPVYDEDSDSLTYDARPDNATSIDLPDEFGQTVLMIDSGCNNNPWDPRC
jgi:hypothetical protein